MNARFHHLSFGTFVCTAILLASCATDSANKPENESFLHVGRVLEVNCVHCHGDNRLSHMPPINDSAELARLIGASSWIVPGRPENSRFFQVVTLSDETPGAMPPTGHAISRQDVAVLRQWIADGAKIPGGPPITFRPRGKRPRSE